MKHIYLRTLRERLKLTQEQLERKSGVSQNQISKLESGAAVRPTHATVVALARALNVDPMRLRFGPSPSRRRQQVSAA